MAAKLKELPSAVKAARLHVLLQAAEDCRKRYQRSFIGQELQMIAEERKGEFWEGYSENYIRLYFSGAAQTGKIAVRAVAEYGEGLLVERI